jgi:phosphate:Na+ symporter
MAEEEAVYNPFRVVSPRVDEEVLRLEELHIRRVSEAAHLEEGLLILISKVMEMTRLLSECMFTGDEVQMDECARLANEVHEEEKILTKDLLSAGVRRDLLRGVLRFPFRLERIGDMLENILNCCRIKNREGVPLGDKAKEDLTQLFSALLEMMGNLREAFSTPHRPLLQSVMTQGQNLSRMLEDSRSSHWERVETGVCAPEASSLYRDILDSMRWTNEYLERMCKTLLDMSEGHATA